MFDDRVKVTAHFKETGSVLKGDKVGEALGFEIEVDLRSDVPKDQIQELIELAHKMCFTESALTKPAPITVVHRLNGEAL